MSKGLSREEGHQEEWKFRRRDIYDIGTFLLACADHNSSHSYTPNHTKAAPHSPFHNIFEQLSRTRPSIKARSKECIRQYARLGHVASPSNVPENEISSSKIWYLVIGSNGIRVSWKLLIRSCCLEDCCCCEWISSSFQLFKWIQICELPELDATRR